MKTIESIIAVSRILNPQLGVSVDINGFKLRVERKPNQPIINNYRLICHFMIELNEYHIQALLNMGVNLQFGKIEKANHANDNTLRMPANCSIEVLEKLNNLCRFNHLSDLSLCNKVQLRSLFPFKEKVDCSNKDVKFEAHIQTIESIRKAARRLPRKTNYQFREKLDFFR